MTQRIFVTGATGVVGMHLVPMLVHAGCDVTAVGRTRAKRERLEQMGARAVPLDLFDRRALRQGLEGHDAVINLATHMPSSTWRMMLPWSWRENDRVRREGSAALAAAASDAGVGRFIQESFAPIYEAGGTAWLDEAWPVRPAPYNRTVLDAERSARQFTERGGIGVVLRFAGFYGPDRFLEDLLDVVRRGWCPLPGPANGFWSSVAHNDAASACAAALRVPAGIYNVCDDEPLTRRAFGAVCAKAIDARPPRMLPAWLTALGGSTMELLSRSQRMSNRTLRNASGWAPRWPSLREGLPAALRELTGSSEPDRHARVA